MNNREFKIGDHIVVQGNRGIVTEITYCNEYKIDFNGKTIGNGLTVNTEEQAEDMISRGYNVEPTGRTATYFGVRFNEETGLKNTPYDNGTYGCLDEFENYGTW